MPRYLSKNGHFICVFTKDMIKIEDDKVRLSMGWNFTKKYDVRYLLIWVQIILRLVFQPRGLPSYWKDDELNRSTVGGIKKKQSYNPSTPNKELKRVENFVTSTENEKAR